MTLEEKLKRLKKIEEQKTGTDWIEYKEKWIDSIRELQHTIQYKWFANFNFSVIVSPKNE